MIQVCLPARAVKREVLHDALRARWQVGAHTIAPFLVLWSAIIYALRGDLPQAALAGWFAATAAALLLRAAQARFMMRRLGCASLGRLRRFERQLGLTGMLMNGALGAGFWVLGSAAGPRVQLLMTLVSCAYSVALLTYHADRFKAYVAGMLCNLGQAVAFWALVDRHDKHLLVAAMLMLLMLTATDQAWRSSVRFRRGVREAMRRRALVAHLEQDKRTVQAALALASEASRSKASFIAAASHGLRQPIHALALFVKALTPTLRRHDQQQLAGCIGQTASSLEALFTNFMDLSRLEADAPAVRVRPFDAHALAARLAAEFGLLAGARGVTLRLRAPAAAWVESDEVLLERVLRNLLANAVQHTERGSIDVLIEPAAHGVRVAVADTGVGIAPADRQRIFDDFVQVRDPARPHPAGFGLGLGIVRRIDRLLGLGVQLHSAPGQGSRFEFLVPAAPAPGASTRGLLPGAPVSRPAAPARGPETAARPSRRARAPHAASA